MKKRFLVLAFILMLLICSSACSENQSGNVDFGDYVIPTEVDTSPDYDVSQILNPDTSWQNAYALSYVYYDQKTGESTIAEGRCGNVYQSLDYASNIITYLTQEDGYMMQYMLDNQTKTGTATIVTEGSIEGLHSGFMMLSVCDPYFPVYKNVTKVGSDFVANRSATRYKQVQTENGIETQIAYVWIDDMLGFASRCELYDAQTQELLMRWELQDFTQNVTEEGVKVDIDSYTLITG